MPLKSKFKSILRESVLKAAPGIIPFIPGKQRRKGLSKALFRRRINTHVENDYFADVAEDVSRLPQGSLSLTDTLFAAQRMRKAGYDDINRDLLEGCYERVRTSSALLVELARDRLKTGRYSEAKTLVEDAMILNPSSQSVARVHVEMHTASEDCGPLRGAMLKRFNGDMSLVWAFCKACKTQEDLDQIYDALASNGTLAIKYTRPYGNAALRAERFDLAREQYLRAIMAAVEKLPKSVTPPKSIGDAGAQALIDIVKLLNSASVPHFAAAGTCLGMVREGRPLPHDSDIDIGIMEQHFDQAALLELAQSSPLFTPSPPHPKNPKVGLKHINGADLDLFKFYEEDGKVWHNGVFVRWGNTPFTFETRALDGVDITIPSGTNYLVENYGEGWKTPDSLFDAFMNGPNREIVWDDYYGAHILRAVNLTLRQGNLKKAMSFVRDGIEGPHLTRFEKDTLRLVSELTEVEISSRSIALIGDHDD